MEVRLRRRGGRTLLTVKSGGARKRVEEEFEIGDARFRSLWPLTEGRRVEKVRHYVRERDRTIELDVYSGELEGLATAEIEFDSDRAAEAFEPPPWLGPEISDDPGYKNQSLALEGRPEPPGGPA